jgi:hypothetical protein
MSTLKKLSAKSKAIMTKTSVLDLTEVSNMETQELGSNESFVVLDDTEDSFLSVAGIKEYKILTSTGIWHLTEPTDSSFAIISDEKRISQLTRGQVKLIAENGLLKIVTKTSKLESHICTSQNDIDSLFCNHFEEVIKLEDVEDMLLIYTKFCVKTISGDYAFLLLEKACFEFVEVEPRNSYLR